jgi:hypothetical protein
MLLEDGGERVILLTCRQPVACLAKSLGVVLLVGEVLPEVVVVIAGESFVGFEIGEPVAVPEMGIAPRRCLGRCLVTVDLRCC